MNKPSRFNFRVWDSVRWEWVPTRAGYWVNIGSNGEVVTGFEDHVDEDRAAELVICPSTGLTDKKNQEAYEGDIGVDEYGERFVIYFRPENACFKVRFLKRGVLPLSERSLSEWEIIGNRFQNPELMEGGA